jgi:hypothetical protein
MEEFNFPKFSPTQFNSMQKNIFDTTMGRSKNKWRAQFLTFLHDAWMLQPKYISKLGPRHCNYSQVMKEFKESMLLPMFGLEVAFYLNGNTNLLHDDFTFPIIDRDSGEQTVIQSFTVKGFFFFFFFFLLLFIIIIKILFVK